MRSAKRKSLRPRVNLIVNLICSLIEIEINSYLNSLKYQRINTIKQREPVGPADAMSRGFGLARQMS